MGTDALVVCRTVERDLLHEFEKSGKVDKVTVVYDQRVSKLTSNHSVMPGTVC